MRLRIGDLIDDASAAAAGAMTGAVVTVPPGVQLARVVTNDPAPAGDLAIRTSPSDSAPQIAGGGAEKDGIVAILDDSDPTYAQVVWPGGARRPAGTGFAHKKFLSVLPGGDPAAPGAAPVDSSGLSTGAMVAIGAAALAVVGGIAWFALK